MPKRTGLCRLLSTVLLTVLLAGCGTDAPAGTEGPTDTSSADEASVSCETKGIFLNIDINTVTFPFLNRLCEQETVTEEDLYPFIDQYVGTQITDIALNVLCQVSVTPTEVMTWLPELLERDEIAGEEVDLLHSVEGEYSLEGLHTVTREHGIDPYAVWFRRSREQGFRTWLSVRPNDCHDPGKISWLHGDLYYEAIEKGWTVGGSDYFRYCFNYAEDEIRARMLAYIREQLTRYDVDGLELDFSREWRCFPAGVRNRADIMTGFFADVNEIVAEAEAKWGHEIKITTRMMRDIGQNLAFGFDLEAIVGQKLVDSVTVCPRWESCDSDMPIDEWKAAFPAIEIYAGLTDLTLGKSTDLLAASAYAAQYLHQGADKIYLFNFYNNPFAPNDRNTRLYRLCGSLETLDGRPQRCIVTYQDTVPSGKEGWKPLPAKLDGFTLDIAAGPVTEEDKLRVILGIEGTFDPEAVRVTVNGVEASYKNTTQIAAAYTSVPQYRFHLPSGSVSDTDGRLTLAIACDDPSLELAYLELDINVIIN